MKYILLPLLFFFVATGYAQVDSSKTTVTTNKKGWTVTTMYYKNGKKRSEVKTKSTEKEVYGECTSWDEEKKTLRWYKDGMMEFEESRDIYHNSCWPNTTSFSSKFYTKDGRVEKKGAKGHKPPKMKMDKH